jgi:hypothetical protein
LNRLPEKVYFFITYAYLYNIIIIIMILYREVCETVNEEKCDSV